MNDDDDEPMGDLKFGYCPVKCHGCGQTKNAYGNQHRCPPPMGQAILALLGAAIGWRTAQTYPSGRREDMVLHSAVDEYMEAVRCEPYRRTQDQTLQALLKGSTKISRSIRKSAKKDAKKRKR